MPDLWDQQSFDRFAYVRNNPINRIDPTGHADVCGIVKGSCKSRQAQPFYTSPDKVESALEVAGDVLRTVSGFYEPIDWVITLSDGFQWYDAAGLLPLIPGNVGRKIGNYIDLKKITKGTEYQVHHLIEKRFARLGLDKASIPSITLTREEHLQFTKAWRKFIGYSRDKKDITTLDVTIDDVWKAAQEIYSNNPEWLAAAKDF